MHHRNVVFVLRPPSPVFGIGDIDRDQTVGIVGRYGPERLLDFITERASFFGKKTHGQFRSAFSARAPSSGVCTFGLTVNDARHAGLLNEAVVVRCQRKFMSFGRRIKFRNTRNVYGSVRRPADSAADGSERAAFASRKERWRRRTRRSDDKRGVGDATGGYRADVRDATQAGRFRRKSD